LIYKSLIQNLSGYIARELKLSDKKKAYIRYALEVLISSLISLIISLGLAYVLNIFWSVFWVIIVAAIMKSAAGGVHLKSPWECAVSTALFTNIMGYLSIQFSYFLFRYYPFFLVVSLFYIMISLYFWSPADVPEKPIKEKSKQRQLKRISFFIAIIFAIIVLLVFLLGGREFAIIGISILFGLIFQAFAISPAAYKIQKFYYIIKQRNHKK